MEDITEDTAAATQAPPVTEAATQAPPVTEAAPGPHVPDAGRAPSAPQPAYGPCPSCGRPVPLEPRDRWCDVCDWNVDPQPAVATKRRLQWRQRRADRRGRRLHDDVLRGGGTRRLAAAASYAVAILVHLPFVICLGLVGLLWVQVGPHAITYVATVVLLIVAYGFRPRFGSMPKGVVLLQRDDAPRLFDLVDAIAKELDTKKVTYVGIDPIFSASVTSIGIRRRRLVTIGLPLWDILNPQERVALLGHEFGHTLPGRLRHHMVVNSALRTLNAWARFLLPRQGDRQGVGTQIYELLGLIVLIVARLQVRLFREAQPLGEYRADEAAASIGSAAGMLGVLDKLILGPKVRHMIGISILSWEIPTMWESLRSRIEAIPERDHERLRRAVRLRHYAVDATHPPTDKRIDAIKARPALPARVHLDDRAASSIDAELAGARDHLRQLLGPGGTARRRYNDWDARAERSRGR